MLRRTKRTGWQFKRLNVRPSVNTRGPIGNRTWTLDWQNSWNESLTPPPKKSFCKYRWVWKWRFNYGHYLWCNFKAGGFKIKWSVHRSTVISPTFSGKYTHKVFFFICLKHFEISTFTWIQWRSMLFCFFPTGLLTAFNHSNISLQIQCPGYSP